MDFSLTTVFVNPVGGTLANAGGTSELTDGKIGLFKKSLAEVAANTDTRFVIAQGRAANEVPQTSKKSDVIDTSRIIRYKNFAPVKTATVKVVDITDFNAKCGEDVTITLRAFSKYLDVSFANGLTRSFTIKTPCCECGEDPCETVDAEALVDEFIAQINASIYKDYLTATKVAATETTGVKLRLTAKVLQQDTPGVNPGNFNYDGYDYVEFYAYAYKGPETTMDEIVADRCAVFATVTTVTKPTVTRGSANEVALVERLHYSYQTGKMKNINCNADWNPTFVSRVTPGTWYNEFVIKFRPLEGNQTWAMHQEIDETVRIFVAEADATAFKNALDGILKASNIENEY